MQGTRTYIDMTGIATMVILCAILGLHQVAIKAVANDIAPIMQISLRSGISAVLVGLYVGIRKERISLRDKALLPGLLLGILFSLEFVFVAEGLRYTTASHMAVFLYTAPVFTALVLHRFIPAERLHQYQWFGIGLAFCGIVVSFLGGVVTVGISKQMLWGDLLALLGGIAWASTTITIRCTSLSEAPATQTLLYQLLAAFGLLLIYAIATGQAQMESMTTVAWSSVLFQGVVITFAVYLVWFSMLRRYNASQLSVFLFLTPVFGITYGVVLLGDVIDVWFVGGALMVLTGLICVQIRPARLMNKG